jgi:tetratricopeptide (TPR) repeat protein
MFFPRLRRQAKWMFVFLALVFGVGFVVFGVGSGQGTGLGDILQGNLGGSAAGPSIGDAREKIEDDPENPAGYRDLATALINNGRPDEAIPAYEDYLELRPKDVEVKKTLANLYLTRANNHRDAYEQARVEAEALPGGGFFGPPQTSEFGRALGGPIDQQFQSVTRERLIDASTKMEQSYSRAATLYSQVVATRPDDEALLQLQLADAAYAARRLPLAIKAYQRFVKLAPDDASAPYARQQIRLLKSGALNVQPG